MDHPTFGRWLKLRRRSLGLTQAQLGEQVGYAGETLRKVEADELRPSRQLAEKLALALKIAPDEQPAFIRFARDEATLDEVVLPLQLKPPPLPSATSPTAIVADRHPPQATLPLPRDPLLGREWEVSVVQNLLLRPTVGLVTLTGPGGVGKSRLALQVAANLLAHLTPETGERAFPTGVYFVPLASLDDPTLVLPAIAQTLNVRETEGQPLLSALQEHLCDQQLLLVLDNFEQVLAAAPRLGDLLQAAPGLKLLVTSRTVLRLREEQTFVVPPLTLPALDSAPEQMAATADPLAWPKAPALRLFVERAQTAQADFALTTANARVLAEICHHLDGLPLAIELAAARIRLLPPQAMLTRLAHPLQLLTGGARDLPTRHQTMRATLAWSYALLEDTEKRLFRQLAVFAGGGRLEAIDAVCSANEADAQAVLDVIASLLDKSLLQQQADVDGEPRFRLLRVSREYALEQLEEQGEAEAVRHRFAPHFLALAEQAEHELMGAAQQVWLDRLALESDNLRAALEICLAEQDGEIGLRLGGALWRFWEV
ncbi:MAG TPA: AAA family ATPase, partial [Caldilineaceae bacterium]|nr:AAA family ATPase [Caldilineaceae bacterium]